MAHLLEHFELIGIPWKGYVVKDYIAICNKLVQLIDCSPYPGQKPMVQIRVFGGTRSVVYRPIDFWRHFSMNTPHDKIEVNMRFAPRGFSLTCAIAKAKEDCWFDCVCPDLSTEELRGIFVELREYLHELRIKYPLSYKSSNEPESDLSLTQSAEQQEPNREPHKVEPGAKSVPCFLKLKARLKKIPTLFYSLLAIFFSAVCALAVWDDAMATVRAFWCAIFG